MGLEVLLAGRAAETSPSAASGNSSDGSRRGMEEILKALPKTGRGDRIAGGATSDDIRSKSERIENLGLTRYSGPPGMAISTGDSLFTASKTNCINGGNK